MEKNGTIVRLRLVFPVPAMKAPLLSFIALCFFVFFFLPSHVFAETTPYRSATTVTTYGNPPFTNISNCSITDGNTCDRAFASSYGFLYFTDFGDFGIPDGSTVTNLKTRVIGKTSTGIYLGVSAGRIFDSSCEHPSDQWTMSALRGDVIKTYSVTTPMTSGNLAYCLSLIRIKTNSFIFRINYASSTTPIWSANIDNFEIAFDYLPPSEVTPTPTSIPQLPAPEPFLELPWNYEGKGLDFTEAALSINSFFDHTYPLLSSGLIEPNSNLNQITTFQNENSTSKSYSSHDGYDYGRTAGAHFGETVLAAADGIASYMNSCGACGNAILIDHENGYQTRYYHLQKDGLITADPSVDVFVTAGQPIGRVGATGNVKPPGEDGAHIHFMVVQDKDADGNFDDNLPDGVTDPYGWHADAPDPWPAYSFDYAGVLRTGVVSTYLWKTKLVTTENTLSTTGGNFVNGRYAANFLPGSVLQNVFLSMEPVPVVDPSATLSSIGTGIDITVKNAVGTLIETFTYPFIVTANFSPFDLTNILPETISFYSSDDGVNWSKENTSVDLGNQSATAEVNHLTQFALFAERKDATPPATLAIFSGEKGNDTWYLSPVTVALEATDGDGLGVDYTLYKVNDGDREEYIEPRTFSENGSYTVEYYSVDNDENIEEKKIASFQIDTTIPEAKIFFDPNALRLSITGHDASDTANITRNRFTRFIESATISDPAGNRLRMGLTGIGYLGFEKLDIKTLQYNQQNRIDLNGNTIFITFALNKNEELTRLEQFYMERGKLFLVLRYVLNKNQTQVFQINSGREILRETLAGMRILQVVTENGIVKYSY